MTILRYFVMETTDQAAAQAAFIAGIKTAATLIGLGDLVPAVWTPFLDVPAARLNALLAANQQLPAGDFLRADLDCLPVCDPDGTVTAYGVNVAFSIRFTPARETALGTALTNWWLSGTLTTRAITAAKAAAFPSATPPAVRERVVGGIATRLLVSPPASPTRRFGGL